MTETDAMMILGFTSVSENQRFGMRSGTITNKNRHEATELELDAIMTLCELWGYTYEEYR